MIVTSSKAILNKRNIQEFVHHMLHTDTNLGSKSAIMI